MTVTVAVSQFVGFSCSQIWYTSVYVPAGVPGATFTAPVAGSIVTFGFVVLTCVSVTVASVAGTPFSVSFTSTFGTAVPPAAPFATAPVSSTASIARAVTVIGGTVDVLLPGFGSVVPTGTVTVAVFAPIVFGVVTGAVPVTVMVTALPAPAAMSTFSATLPLPLAVPQAALPVAAQLQVTPVNWAGTVSETEAPARSDGPALVTTS